MACNCSTALAWVPGLPNGLAMQIAHLVRANDDGLWMRRCDGLGFGQRQALGQRQRRFARQGRFIHQRRDGGKGQAQAFEQFTPVA